MAKPPPTPPSSDLEGVNRDARAGAPHKNPHPDPGAAIQNAHEGSRARPDESEGRPGES